MINKLKSAKSLIFSLTFVVLLSAQTGCAGLDNTLEGRGTTPEQTGIYSFNDDLKAGSKGPEMVVVPKGRFIMGDLQGIGKPNEQAHEVNINQAFAIGKFEVTVSQFRQFVKSTGYVTSAEKGQGCFTYGRSSSVQGKAWKLIERTDWSQPSFEQSDNHPVVCVSWHDAVAYTGWLSEQTGHQYQLPTEAQWEYVARAGTRTHFWWGNDLDNDSAKCTNANCCLGTSWIEKQTLPVGSYQANGFGVHDTAGNVWEWTASNYVEKYNGEEQKLSDISQVDSMRTMRGGSWYNFPSDTRAAKRASNWPQERVSTIGFRVARVVSPELVKVALKDR